MAVSSSSKLYGLDNSNRDFSIKDNWGKNVFNNTFPASLVCYMNSKNIDSVYLKINDNLEVVHSTITYEELFGLPHPNNNLFFSFESEYTPYSPLISDGLPRLDLITMSTATNSCLRPIEIKLTALPDNSTCRKNDESEWSCELVIRPDVIVYIALSIAQHFTTTEKKIELNSILGKVCNGIEDWSDISEMIRYVVKMGEIWNQISRTYKDFQEPIILQPVWKTLGKSPFLAENCLDSFVWSNLGLTRILVDHIMDYRGRRINKMTRQMRTIIWLVKLLYDYSRDGRCNFKWIKDNMAYNLTNDKAFASSGSKTLKFMRCSELENPRIKKEDIKNIILGGGHKLLSPERRFDAIIFYSIDLFENE